MGDRVFRVENVALFVVIFAKERLQGSSVREKKCGVLLATWHHIRPAIADEGRHSEVDVLLPLITTERGTTLQLAAHSSKNNWQTASPPPHEPDSKPTEVVLVGTLCDGGIEVGCKTNGVVLFFMWLMSALC